MKCSQVLRLCCRETLARAGKAFDGLEALLGGGRSGTFDLQVGTDAPLSLFRTQRRSRWHSFLVGASLPSVAWCLVGGLLHSTVRYAGTCNNSVHPGVSKDCPHAVLTFMHLSVPHVGGP